MSFSSFLLRCALHFPCRGNPVSGSIRPRLHGDIRLAGSLLLATRTFQQCDAFDLCTLKCGQAAEWGIARHLQLYLERAQTDFQLLVTAPISKL